jgi:hypothetical protein
MSIQKLTCEMILDLLFRLERETRSKRKRQTRGDLEWNPDSASIVVVVLVIIVSFLVSFLDSSSQLFVLSNVLSIDLWGGQGTIGVRERVDVVVVVVVIVTDYGRVVFGNSLTTENTSVHSFMKYGTDNTPPPKRSS